MLLGMQASRNGSDFVLSLWSEASTDASGTMGPTADLARELVARGWGNAQFLVVYACVVSINFFCSAIRSWGFAAAGLRAARSMHDRLLAAVVAAPQRFHDATPAGRLQNRLSGDVFAIDDSLPFSLNILLAQGTFNALCTFFFCTPG
jgi:ATP-binding cassette subfamily C (CFTR/MRP) protein 10